VSKPQFFLHLLLIVTANNKLNIKIAQHRIGTAHHPECKLTMSLKKNIIDCHHVLQGSLTETS